MALSNLRTLARAFVFGSPPSPTKQPNRDQFVDLMASVQSDILDVQTGATAGIAAVQTLANQAISIAGNAALPPKESVRAASQSNVTIASALEDGDTLDGVTLATGDRVLLVGQSTGSQNGIYVVAASGAASRSADLDVGSEFLGARVYVQEGATNGGTTWACLNSSAPNVGSSNIAFTQVNDQGDVAVAVGFLQSDTARVNEQAGASPHLQVAAATATGHTVDFGSYAYTFTGALGTWGAGQLYIGEGAALTWTSNSLAVVLSDYTAVDGLKFVGAGRASGSTSNSALRIPNDMGGVMLRNLDMRDMGGDAIQILNNADRKGSRVEGYFFDNHRAINLVERAEYNIISVNISSTAINVGDALAAGYIGIDMVGGNNMVIGSMVTNQGTAVRVGVGANDAHGLIIGSIFNHNDVGIETQNHSVKDMGIIGNHTAATKNIIGGQGERWVANGFRSFGLEEKSTATNTMVALSTFSHMPDDPTYSAYGGYVPNSGGASAVQYWGNLYPDTLAADSEWRQWTAESKRTRASSAQSVAASATADIDFNTSIWNRLHGNTAFSKYELWNTTNKCWTMHTFASSGSQGKAEVDLAITVKRTDAGSFDKANVNLWLSLRDGSNVEQERRPLHKSDVIVSGSRDHVIYTLNGNYQKYPRMAVELDNAASHDVEVVIHSAPLPSQGYVWGW